MRQYSTKRRIDYSTSKASKIDATVV